MDILKKNYKAFTAAFLGLFHFILLAIPFVSAFAKMGGESESQSVSGYTCLGSHMGELSGGIFLLIAQILFLIAAIGLLLIGAYMLVSAFLGDKINLPQSFGPISPTYLYTWIHLGYAAAGVLMFLATVIVSIANTETQELFGYTMSAGISIGFGSILGFVLSAGSFVGVFLLEKNGIMGNGGASQSGGPRRVEAVSRARLVCSQCGQTAQRGSAFCSKCGGKVVEVVPTKPVCVACGAPAKRGDAFCSLCGGKVEEVAQTKPVCESCGAPAKKGDAFCALCGGKIVQK